MPDGEEMKSARLPPGEEMEAILIISPADEAAALPQSERDTLFCS
jgi:hypothetical protein